MFPHDRGVPSDIVVQLCARLSYNVFGESALADRYVVISHANTWSSRFARQNDVDDLHLALQ